MFDLKNVDICVSTRYLIRNLNLTLNKGDKCAIIGEEGNGKSTILKCILGQADYAIISGFIDLKGLRVGYLEQSLSDKDKRVFDFLFLDNVDYYNKLNGFYKLIGNFNIKEDLLKKNMNTLSGGELVKIAILKILLDDPDILFLDEPTNDLDIAALEWLGEFINSIDKPILYVSHDETLLSKTANMILHIEQLKKKTECKHTLVRCGYDEYVAKRLRKIEAMTQIAKNERREQEKKKERLNRIMNTVEQDQRNISRKDPHGARVLKKKMKTLKVQEKRINTSELSELPDPEENINFFFCDVNIPKNKEILRLKMEKLEVPFKVLAKNIELDVIGPKHITIIGENGVGKTTLLKEIIKVLESRKDIKVGIMPQDYNSYLTNYKTPLEFVASTDINDITEARKYLGNMKFTREEMCGDIRNLSNGEIAKLFITKLVKDKCDVLVLDEPTRNVSPLSNPVIRNELKNFKGTIISVSHDRKFIEEVSTDIYELTVAGLRKVE